MSRFSNKIQSQPKMGPRSFTKIGAQGRRSCFRGWPLNAQTPGDSQMLFLGQKGYDVVAHDRRGHGRSSQPWDGNSMDTYADDLRRCSTNWI